MTTFDALRKGWEEHIFPTYGTPTLGFVRGEGAALFDADDRPYLDFLSGLAVTSLGHAHPAVAQAVSAQVRRLTHTSNLFITPPAVELAGELAGISGWADARVFFANSGAEANEAAIKLARRHGLAHSPDKHRLVTLTGSFHGRTLATLEATGQTAKHAPFEPLAGYVDHVAWDDPDALRAAVDERTCGVLLEVIQGEGGVRQVPDEVLLAARDACDEHDALLIVDEVQTGMGRTGDWFAWQGSPIEPDVMTLAKALANGLPIGACVARGRAAGAFAKGDHASTFGGNPVSCAAAVAVINTMQDQDLVGRARTSGERFAGELRGLAGDAPFAAGVRGRGLLLGLELDAEVAGEVETACRDRYLIVNAVAPDVVRFAPPLTVTDDEIDLALAAVTEALHAVADRRRARERRGGGGGPVKRVLVIEDDDSVVQFLEAYLPDRGYEVVAASDGLVGLVKLQMGHPDAVVLDIMMPDVDGIRVLEQMLEEGDGELPQPVIVITGYPEGAARCRELLDPADVFDKPFDPDDLVARLNAHLGDRSQP